MSDRFLQGIFEDFIRGITSPITSNVGGSAVPANAITTDTITDYVTTDTITDYVLTD